MSGKLSVEQCRELSGKYTWPKSYLVSAGVYYVVHGEKEDFDQSIGAICMASLGQLGDAGLDGLYLESSSCMKAIMPIKLLTFYSGCPSDYHPFLKWVVEESLWSECFINSFEDICANRLVYLDTSKPVQFVVGACSMIRATWEHSPCVELWMEGVDSGLTPEEALVYAFAHKGEPPLTRLNTWHAPIEFPDIESVDSFINRKPVNFKDVPFASDTGYGGFTSIFSKKNTPRGAYNDPTEGLPPRDQIPSFLIERRNNV